MSGTVSSSGVARLWWFNLAYTVSRYVADHFNGRLALSLSFWVNFIAIGALLHGAVAMFRGAQAIENGVFVLVFALPVLQSALYVWQVCGVWRACEHALLNHAWYLWARTAQVAVVASVVAAFGEIFAWGHLALRESPPPIEVTHPDYRLALADNGTVVLVTGSIDFGLTDALRRILEDRQTVDTVSLTSNGGMVSEAKGLATLIERHGLSTRVETHCASACTHVFVSGSHRTIAPDARLGFHSYRLESPYVGIFLDPALEQRKDLSRFRRQGVDEHFIERIVATPPSDLWFPSPQVLLDAGVVHAVRATTAGK